MAPVVSTAIDSPVPLTAQMIATWVTLAIAVTTTAAVIRYCAKHKLWWPMIVVVSGLITCLQEPLYDHLYGLWFKEQGQVNAFTTYGIHVPLWLPIIYVAYYGCGTVWYWHQIEHGATMRRIMVYFAIEVFLAGMAEQFYINVAGLYNYQTNQPFYVLNYPIFVAVVNGVPPTLAAIILYRLVPLLKDWQKLLLLPVVPIAFATNSFGSCWLYISARHATPAVSQFVLHLAALSAVVGSVLTIWVAAKLAGIGQIVPERA